MILRKLLLPLLLCFALFGCESSEERAQGHYERGLALLEEGDDVRARLEFRNALKLLNTMLEPRVELARLNMKEGAFAQAFREYLRIAEQEPDNIQANIALGQLAFRIKDWENFERYSTRAAELAPEDEDVRVLALARRYMTAVGDEDGPARSALVAEAEELSLESPDSDILRQMRIDGYLADNRFADALTQLDDAIVVAPENFQFYMLRLQLMNQIGDVEGLEKELRRMVGIFPESEITQANLLRFLIARNRADEAEAYLRDRVAAAPEEDTTAFMNLVQFLLLVRDRDAALDELEAVVQAKPDAYTLRAFRASLQFDTGARDDVIEEMQSIIDAAESSEDTIPQEELNNIKITLATMLNTEGNEVGARRLVEEVLADTPEMIGALKMQARWMIADDDTTGAINAMRVVLAEVDQDYEAMTIMAQAYQRAGKQGLMLNSLSLAAEAANNAPEQALRYAAALRADGKLLQAESALITSLRVQPNNIDVLAVLGQIYLEMDDLPRAEQVTDTLKKIDDEGAQSIATGFELELLQRQSGKEEVMAYLKTLTEQADGGDDAKIALIQVHLQSGETDAALVLINELIAQNPDNLTFVYFRGLTEAMAGALDVARQTFTDLTEKNPDADLGWLQLARLQTIEDDPAAVLKTLDAGLAANPDSADLLWTKASFLQEQEDIDGAIEIYEQLYGLHSGSMIVANNLASLLATYRDDQESLERAQVIARRLVDTEVPALQDTYGWIQHRLGNTEEALAYLEPAAKGLPGDASVQFHLGEVYNALGRKEEALSQMRLAMQSIGPLGTGALSDRISARIQELGTANAAETSTEPAASDN